MLPPILCAHLLPKIDAHLIELLRSLDAEDWDRPTIVPRWNVKQIAAHLLDTPLRKLSMVRDGYFAGGPASHEDLTAFIDSLNAQGIAVYGRLSPQVLISLMEMAVRESAALHASLDPFAPAIFAVSWAGEDTSLNWFDTARELTERWHHQQEIREAVNRPGIMTRELYHPVLDCFLRGLPYAYRAVDAAPGTYLQIDISGDCGGSWWLVREASSWSLTDRPERPSTARIEIPQEIAWRVFTKGIPRAEAAARSPIEGDRKLAENVLRLTAIVG